MGSTKRMLCSVAVVCGKSRDCAGALRQPELCRQGVGEVTFVRSPIEALDLLIQGQRFGLVFICQQEHNSEIISFIRNVRSIGRRTPVVVVSKNPTIADAVQFVRAGALDYVRAPIDEETLSRLIRGSATEELSSQQRRFFCDECPDGVEIVGRGPAIVEHLKTIRVVSESGCDPVLILGETGTGKELAARAVHWWRCGDFKRFVAVNCATLNANLLESELFGHVKGAFTGADRDKIGLFEQAADGSIFLDEISEMTPALQSKLLRVIQEKNFRRVGGTKEIPCTAAVIASSNKVLLDAVKEGRVREDLYYRLAVFPIVIPPLRHESRREDVPLLAEYFIGCSDIPGAGGPLGLARDAVQKLIQHDWPGNVRELRNVIERAIILEKAEEIAAASLVFDHQTAQLHQELSERPQSVGKQFSLKAAERELIARALKESGGRRTQAAAMLGITRTTLHDKLKRYDIQSPSIRGRPASAKMA